MTRHALPAARLADHSRTGAFIGPPALAAVIVLVVIMLGSAPGRAPVIPPPAEVAAPGWTAVAVALPVATEHRVHAPDVLVVGQQVGDPTVRRLAKRTGATAAAGFGLASLPVSGRSLAVATVDPAAYRWFSPAADARMRAVWEAVARGEAALTHQAADSLEVGLGDSIRLGSGSTAPVVRVGAIATTVPGVDLVLNDRWASFVGIPADNAVVLALSEDGVDKRFRRLVRRLIGPDAMVDDLSPADTGSYVAGLAGSPLGSFSYVANPDGTVTPDAAWVAQYIRTEEVPVLGAVTCHVVMLPRLRGALADIERAGLAPTIDTRDFGGCYAPRFIERNPARGLSLHTWGIAVDLNVTGNQVGTPGTMDPGVIAIFQRWGFVWGGLWSNPDPMHFELATLG